VSEDHRRLLIPDYEIPKALIIAHGNFTIRETLEDIAEEASRDIGVILFSSDPIKSRLFVANCSFPDRFSIVAAPFDTPWVRDRAPIAVADKAKCRWLLPRSHMEGRQLDSRLFRSISSRAMEELDLVLPQGNLLGGPAGLAISTDRVLADNQNLKPNDLLPFKQQLGIRDWLLIRALDSDTIGHADCYLRFLGPELMALAHAPGETVLNKTMKLLRHQLSELFPGMDFLSLPVQMRGGMLESSLNWIQIGQLLLVPLFPRTSAQERERIEKTLAEHSFRVVFVSSPTSQYGGALHCLTASVFF